jgi:hypothetical protein
MNKCESVIKTYGFWILFWSYLVDRFIGENNESYRREVLIVDWGRLKQIEADV